MKEALVAPRGHRTRYIDISPELILQLLQVPESGVQVISDGRHYTIRPDGDRIPDDAKALRVGLNEYGGVRLIVESEEFPEVIEGNVMRALTPAYSQTDFPMSGGDVVAANDRLIDELEEAANSA